MPAPGVRLAIRTSIAGFQLTLPLGTLRLSAGHAAPQHDGLRRRTSTQRTTQQNSMHPGRTPQQRIQPDHATDGHRPPTRVAVLRRRLEAASGGTVIVSGVRRGPAVAAAAGAPALDAGRVLDSLQLTAEEPDDSFLLRWLRSRNHDVEEAEAAVRTHASWRAQCVPVGGVAEVCAAGFGGYNGV